MAIGLKTKVQVKGLDDLVKQIKTLKALTILKNNKEFQLYLQQKCLQVVNLQSIVLIPNGDMKDKYILNNKIKPLENGFLIYNDTTIPTELEGYNGVFSIALAFEYGTGIVGEKHPVKNAWQYNVNHHTTAWVYYANGSFHITEGLKGMEIYRKSKDMIEKNLSNWVIEYCKKKEVTIND